MQKGCVVQPATDRVEALDQAGEKNVRALIEQRRIVWAGFLMSALLAILVWVHWGRRALG